MRRRELLTGAAACVLGSSIVPTSRSGEGFKTGLKLLELATASDRPPLFPVVDTSGIVWVPHISSATVQVRRDGVELIHRTFGQHTSPRTAFVLASISKPITAAGVMILSDRNQLSLSDSVSRYVPEFRGGSRDSVRVQHLLTHTSGLPDGFPELTPLVRSRVPLKAILRAACEVPLLFTPGSQFSYSNLGFLLAAEVVERITTLPFRTFLRGQLFEPLGMLDTSLGLGGRRVADTAQCQLPGNSKDDDAFSNSQYWRDIGAPWNGVHSTAADLTKFLDLFLRPGYHLLKRQSAIAMITDQTAGLSRTLPQGRLARTAGRLGIRFGRERIPADPWGIGWMVSPGAFGKYCSGRTFGHHGLSGTLAWADPETKVTFALLTTKPIVNSRDGLLGPISDSVSRALRVYSSQTADRMLQDAIL
jgi:CubicO group peptidase (beta-lactamase class C family)